MQTRQSFIRKWVSASELWAVLSRDVNVSFFLWSNISFFFTPLKKTSFRFVFVWNTNKKNVLNYFDIELVTIDGASIRY